MTEKTDIAALRSEAANIIGLLTTEGHQSFTLDKAADFFDDVFRLLEAERQRADELEAAALAMRNDMRLAREELAALRSEKEPVEISDAMALAFHSATTDSAIGNDDVEEIKAGLKAVQDIFTRQPKPVVVLPRLTVGEVMHRSGFDRQYAEGWVSANDWAINELKASGIVVKDGE